MTLNDFTDSCNKFAADSADWGGINPYKHYVAVDGGDWAESCDNHENGIPLAWAFGLTGKLNCLPYYVSSFEDELRVAEDDGWDDDQRRKLYEKFEDCIVNSEGAVFCDRRDAIANMMDDELREKLHAELAPCTDQEFFTAYAAAHKEKFGEQWELDKANPTL